MISDLRPLESDAHGQPAGREVGPKTARGIRTAAAAVLAFGLAAAGGAEAYEPGDFMVQLLAAGFYTGASGEVAGDTNYDSGGMSANPALNLTYFLTRNIAAQTVIAVPWARVDTNSGGQTNKVTDQWVLPLSLIAQYHFLGDEMISPFVGAGMTYAKFWEDQSHNVGGSHVEVDDTWGGLINFGINIKIPDSRWVAVLDFKKWWLSPTNMYVGGNKVGNLRADPVFFGAGVGYNFSTPTLF